MSTIEELESGKLTTSDVSDALHFGYQQFLKTRLISMAFALPVTIAGMVLMWFLNLRGFSLLFLIAAIGFTMIAPALITGYFSICRKIELGEKISYGTPYRGFFSAPMGVWLISALCSFLFLIWITDAGILYSFMIGQTPMSLIELEISNSNVLKFWFWSSVMGSALGLIVFLISAFSVPLLQDRRASLVQSIIKSIATVFRNYKACALWAVVLSIGTILATLITPLLLLMIPVLSYAGYYLYQHAFPQTEEPDQ